MNAEKILDFMNLVENLKKTKRTGWIRNKIANPESVADHSYRTALLALVLSDELNVDRDVMVKMALIHDIGECIIGDFCPTDIEKREKQKLEKKALEKLAKLSNEKEIIELWTEFELGETLESQYIQQIDKLEMVIQALEYEKTSGKKLDEFWNTSKEVIKNNVLLEIFEALEKRRLHGTKRSK